MKMVEFGLAAVQEASNIFFDPKDRSVRTILDIYNSDRVNKQINDLRVSGDTIFISTEFGLSLINSNSFVFYDTYYKFGNLSSNIRVVSTFKHNLMPLRIWYCCSERRGYKLISSRILECLHCK